MIQTVKDYQNLIQRIPELLENTPYKMSHIINKTAMARPTFYRKLKNGAWTPEEVIKLLEFIDPKAFYRHEFERELALAEQDVAAGRLVENEKVLERIKERLTK